MFSYKRTNNVMKIYERTLRLIHNNYENRLNGLFEINNKTTFYVKRINLSNYINMDVIYVNGLSNCVTKRNTEYNLRNYKVLTTHRELTILEVVAQRCSVKKVFLEFLQN